MLRHCLILLQPCVLRGQQAANIIYNITILAVARRTGEEKAANAKHEASQLAFRY